MPAGLGGRSAWKPKPLRIVSQVTAGESVAMLQAFRRCGVSKSTRMFFRRLAEMPPRIRFRDAVKDVSSFMAENPSLSDAVTQALSIEAYQSYVEVAACFELEQAHKATADRLMMTQERQSLVHFFRSAFSTNDDDQALRPFDDIEEA